MKREEIFPQLPLPPELAYDFLGTFARCEYALKTSGFAKAKRNSVEADWDNFAEEVGKHFARIEDDEFKSAVAYLIAEPPRKQVLHEGRLSWKDSPPNAKILVHNKPFSWFAGCGTTSFMAQKSGLPNGGLRGAGTRDWYVAH